MTLWNGRFSSPMAKSLWDLSESYSFDHVLYAHDIAGRETGNREAMSPAVRSRSANSSTMWARIGSERAVKACMDLM